MDFNQILANFRDAFARLMSLRVLVTSPRERVADVSALYAIILVLMTPVACVLAAVLGLVFHYSIRFERDAAYRV